MGPGKLDIGLQAVRIADQFFQIESRTLRDETSSRRSAIRAGRAPGHIGYDWGAWYARWGIDYIKGTNDQPFVEDLGFPAEVFDFSVPDYWLHTASLRFEPSNRYSLTLGVRNVFDKKPPKITAEDPFVNTIANVPLQAGFDTPWPDVLRQCAGEDLLGSTPGERRRRAGEIPPVCF